MPDEKRSLYELTMEEEAIKAELDSLLDPEPDPETGEIPDMSEKLNKLIQEVGDKLDRYLHVMETYEYRAALSRADYKTKEEIIKRSLKQAQSDENKVKALKGRILGYMQDTDKTEMLLDSGRGFVIHKNGGKAQVVIPDNPRFDKWPVDLYITEVKPDNDAIREAFKENPESIPVGVTVFRGVHLKIK